MADGSSRNGSAAGERARHRAEAALAELTRGESAIAYRARRAIGVTGRAERVPFVATLDVAGAGAGALLSLWALAFADSAAARSLVLALPAARVTMGVAALSSFDVVRLLLVAAGGAGALLVLDRWPRRARAARWAAATSAAGLTIAALSTSSLAMLAGGVIVAGASGVSGAVILPLVMDLHRPEIRARAVGGVVASVMGGIGGAAVLDAVLGGVGLTWRTSVLVVAGLALLAGVAARLPDVVPGTRDRRRIEALVEQDLGTVELSEPTSAEVTAQLTTAEKFGRVLSPRSALALLTVGAAFGMVVWGFPPYLAILLRDRWAQTVPQRALVFALLNLAAVPGVLWVAARAESRLRQSAQGLVIMLATVVGIGAAALAGAAVAPVFPAAVALLVLAFAAFAGAIGGAAVMLLTLNEPAHRGHASVLIALSFLVGGVAGGQLLGTIGSRFGVEWAILVTAAASINVAVGLQRVIPTVDADLETLVGRIVEVQELKSRVALGQHLPLLSCRHVDFAYGQVQVLFDVSFTVDDGEMVALLGTNGAGKSTLLRLISGLNPPSAGSIHFRGADVTYTGADRRVRLGISQIPGGRAVFGPLTVVDNLRAYGHMLGRRRQQLDHAIEETFAALPRLGERRNQLASTLSGGEQQMLGLGKAFILQPRMLLIDELSLGLAPIVVGDLLEMVRRINAEGTAVVLVEQSVNIALSVVNHAYFLEKGEVRFDGAAADLLARPDLLRSVFLQGATRGISAMAGGTR